MSDSFTTSKNKFLSDTINDILPKTNAVDILVDYFYHSGYVQLSKKLKNKNIREISISNLISYGTVKAYIDRAESFYNESDFYESIINSKIAFMELLSTYEDNKRKPYSFNKSKV